MLPADIAPIWYLAQAIGFIAFCLGIGAMLQSNDKRLKLLLAAQSATLALHYYLLGAQSGVAIVLVNCLRNLVSAYTNVKHFSWLFIAVFIGSGALSYQTPTDLLPTAASVISTYMFFHSGGIPLRLSLIFTSSLFLLYNIVHGSIGPSIMEFMMMCANGHTAWRLWQQKKVIVAQ